MTAEIILKEAYTKILAGQSSEHSSVDPILLDAMKEYARLMIEQDRERVKYAVNYPYKDEYGCTCNVPGVVDMIPITLT